VSVRAAQIFSLAQLPTADAAFQGSLAVGKVKQKLDARPALVAKSVLLPNLRPYTRLEPDSGLMAHRGDLAALDRQIETLMAREKLSEPEVKALCEKARRCPRLRMLARSRPPARSTARPPALPPARSLVPRSLGARLPSPAASRL
jgi:hypothetical protein